MKQSFNIKNRGFTLIELLVVIAIIGLLSSIVLVSLDTARAKARDARRLSDIKQIQNALEMYRNDHGVYPGTSNAWAMKDSTASVSRTAWSVLETALVSGGYIPELPTDPKPVHGSRPYDAGVYGYGYFNADYLGCSGRKWYMLAFRSETNKNTYIGPGWYRCDGQGILMYTGVGLYTFGVGK